MTQRFSEPEAQPFIEHAITMTPRDHSREDFERRIRRMMLCLSDTTSRAGTGQELRVDLLGYEGDAGKRTLRFRYRLVPVAASTPLAHPRPSMS